MPTKKKTKNKPSSVKGSKYKRAWLSDIWRDVGVEGKRYEIDPPLEAEDGDGVKHKVRHILVMAIDDVWERITKTVVYASKGDRAIWLPAPLITPLKGVDFIKPILDLGYKIAKRPADEKGKGKDKGGKVQEQP